MIILNRNTSNSENNYFQHTKQHGWWECGNKSNREVLREYSTRPICPRCERMAMGDKNNTATCPHCHWHGKRNSTATLDEVITHKLYK